MRPEIVVNSFVSKCQRTKSRPSHPVSAAGSPGVCGLARQGLVCMTGAASLKVMGWARVVCVCGGEALVLIIFPPHPCALEPTCDLPARTSRRPRRSPGTFNRAAFTVIRRGRGSQNSV